MPDDASSIKIGVCGIACQICPRMRAGRCPNGPEGCRPRENSMCKLADCALGKGVDYCFSCPEFPCENTRQGPVSYGYCQYISGRD